MGAALALGMGRASEAITFHLCNRSPQKAQQLARELTDLGHHVRVHDEAQSAAQDADVLILAVKPWDILPMLQTLSSLLTARPLLVISLAAGVALAQMQDALPAGAACRLMRAMPNTPVRVGEGVTALLRGSSASTADVTLCEALFASTGTVIELSDEQQIHALIALAGSAPAYFFDLLDSMAAAGAQLGIPREQALLMAAQTMRGAAALQLASDDDPKTLRNAVTSPQGTTLAALRKLHALGVKDAWEQVLHAAHDRSREMEKERRAQK